MTCPYTAALINRITYFLGSGPYKQAIVVTPGLLQKISKKCNSPEEFLVVVLVSSVLAAFFFEKMTNKRKI